ncbi:hypothetical protein FVR03_04395 [Pontibacter qinzhouensis]|uniref:Uncharacterized protein n=1 Tax=Pontibacter qinzhouensis TaxID=2603253 RepID=A0A5C8KAT4_9BACT|nr:hypothetical protein [Pontibacter qinzhouensis]TXK50736.1 hypothetical protein FVR03_04395 [Pontibacter qinzhouensis]
MRNQKLFRIALAVACFVFAGLKAYAIAQGDYTWIDVFFMIAFLGFGIMYLIVLNKTKKP